MVYVRFAAHLVLLAALLFLQTPSPAAVSHTSSGWGSGDPAQFRALAPPNSLITQAFVTIYAARAQDPQTFRQARFERSQDFLVQKVAKDFKNALGGKDDWAIIAAEGINTSPLLGGKGKTDSHRFSARAFAELLGSMPGTTEDPLLERIAKKKSQFETEMNDLERKKESKELTNKELTALEYAKLGYWAAEEAEKMLKEGDSYGEPSGKGEMVAFKQDFAKEFADKVERVHDFDALVDKAANGDEQAKKTLIDSFAALPTYFTTQSPERANKAVRAVGSGPDNLIKLYDQNGKEFPVKFGKTDEEIQNTIAKWADRYRNGDFELKPPAGAVPTAATTPVSAPQLAQDQLAQLQQRQASEALQTTLSPPRGQQALPPGPFTATQQELQQAQQQFLASRNAQERQAAFNQAQNAIRNAFLVRRAQAQAQVAQQRQLFAQFGYPYSPVITRRGGGGDFSARDTAKDSVADTVSNDGRCTGCHAPKTPEQLFSLLHEGGTMPDGTALASILDAAQVEELKQWAKLQ
ncbi:MAG: hypothetical protein KDD51_00820 [Bdellovibrionales bacterium]|nr:hypothetical protein [Bdellovibrionales bacterium]